MRVGGREGVDLGFGGILKRGDEVIIGEGCLVGYGGVRRVGGGVGVYLSRWGEKDFKGECGDVGRKVRGKRKGMVVW